MKATGIFFGSSSGNTERIAKKIQARLGEKHAKVYDVTFCELEDIEQYDRLIFGIPTWGIGDMQDDFMAFTDLFDQVKWTNKTVALFGLGDQEAYPDSFVDALGEVYELLVKKACKLVGQTSPEGYDFEQSKALIDGQFAGMVIDEDCQANLTDERIGAWLDMLRPYWQ